MLARIQAFALRAGAAMLAKSRPMPAHVAGVRPRAPAGEMFITKSAKEKKGSPIIDKTKPFLCCPATT
jgi:hypothetical protein